MSERKSYYSYSASGSAAGGMLTAPSPLIIPTQAMASLSPSGGNGTASVENFGIPGLLSIRKATTTVQGDPKQTEVTVSIEDVRVMDVLSVNRIILHLVCQTPEGAEEASITPAGSLIEGLAVRGEEVPLASSAAVFDRNPTYTALEQAYQRRELNGLIIAPDSLGALCTAPAMGGCQSRIGDVKGTLYSLENYGGPLPVVNGGLRVKGFGTLYLGEYRISRFARRLTMLRVELGCDTSGSLGLGDGSGNGHGEPPN